VLISFDSAFKAVSYENCNPRINITVVRDKEEELEREKNLRKDVEQRYKVNCRIELLS